MELLLSLLAFAAAAITATAALRLALPPLLRLLAARAADDQRLLAELFIRGVSPQQVLLATAGTAAAAAVVIVLASNNWFLAVLVALAIGFLPRIVLAQLRARRRQRFEELLPDSLTLLANSARAGMSLKQGLDELAEHAPSPVCEEVAVIVQDDKLRGDLDKSLGDARERLRSRGFDLVSTVLQIHREKGGNLAAALERMAASMKEIWRLEQKLYTSSAEGRKAARLISGTPIFIFVMVSVFDPSIPQTLFRSFIGMALVAVATLLYGIGLWWMLRILRWDV